MNQQQLCYVEAKLLSFRRYFQCLDKGSLFMQIYKKNLNHSKGLGNKEVKAPNPNCSEKTFLP